MFARSLFRLHRCICVVSNCRIVYSTCGFIGARHQENAQRRTVSTWLSPIHSRKRHWCESYSLAATWHDYYNHYFAFYSYIRHGGLIRLFCLDDLFLLFSARYVWSLLNEIIFLIKWEAKIALRVPCFFFFLEYLTNKHSWAVVFLLFYLNNFFN